MTVNRMSCRSLWFLLVVVLTCVKQGGLGQTPENTGWPTYSNQPDGTRFSPLTQINRSNVARLKVAWSFRTGALGTPLGAEHDHALDNKAAFEATPIVVAGKLFLSTPYAHVIALDPRTGMKLWEFDPKLELPHGASEVTSRGVSAWRDRAQKGGVCSLRVFVGTIDARLIALDGENENRAEISAVKDESISAAT